MSLWVEPQFGLPGFPGSMSTPTDLLLSPPLAIDTCWQNWACTAIPKRLTYNYCMAIYGLCNAVKGTVDLILDLTLDLDSGLKMASNLRCGRITFKHVMSRVCWPSLVTIGAVVVAPIAWQADSHTQTYIRGLCFMYILAEVPDIARVIVRLAAILTTSRLGHSSTRTSCSTLPALTWEPLSSGPEISIGPCVQRSMQWARLDGWPRTAIGSLTRASRSTRSWSWLDSKLVLPRLEAGLASTRSWSCLDSTRSWSRLGVSC